MQSSYIAFLYDILSIKPVIYYDSNSIVTFSIGSNVTPVSSHFFVNIYGGDTYISKPSLLIFSNNIAKCKSPLPNNYTHPPSSVFSFINTYNATSL